jgi:hypothetical protein
VIAVLTALIGVAATLLGSFTAYYFQSRVEERARAYERREHRRQEQLDACSAFAAAASDLKKAFVDVWFGGLPNAAGSEQARKDAYAKAGAEADRLAAGAQIARFRVQLVSGDPQLVALADTAFNAAGAILRGSDHVEIRSLESQFDQAVGTFIRAASQRLAQSDLPVGDPPSARSA